MFEAQQCVLIVLTIAGWVALARLCKGARCTTLFASWCWAGVSLTALATAELAIAWCMQDSLPAWVSHLHYCAAVTTFAPVMAVFGAKRPQNRAWQLIVLALLAILVMPSVQALLFRAGEPLALHTARRWFLVILVGMGLLNYIGTRFSLSTLLFAAAQVVLLGEALPAVGKLDSEWRPAIGLGMGVAGLVLIALRMPRARLSSRPIDRCWIDFRDAFGAVWAWRVLERVNATAAVNNWPARLTWHGMAETQNAERQILESVQADAQRAMLANLKSLLRRFVNVEWIEARVPNS